MLHSVRSITLLLVASSAACALPRDAEDTLDRVRQGTVRVGVAQNPPWVIDGAGGVEGVEARLVTDLAREIGARVHWVSGPADELLASLEKRELDLVIGGFTDDSPWKKSVAFTKPYYTDTIMVGAPAGSPDAGALEGKSVTVRTGDPTAAALREKRATPVFSDDLARTSGLIAAPSWQLSVLGRAGQGQPLREAHHVLAAPLGENAWLVHLERRLRARRDEVPRLLRSTAR